MMKTDEVVEELRKLIPISNPKNQKELENPNYALYALAPFWLPHQAICLLAQLKTVDEHTFRTCLSLKQLQTSINFALYGKEEWTKEITKAKPSGKMGFSDFIMHHFPIPHSKITFLKNLHEKLSEAIKNDYLSSKNEFQNNSQKTLLSPTDVVLWAQKEKIIVPSRLLEGLSFRDQINMLYLPKIFKDEINVYDKWNTLCTEHKLSNPFSPLFKKPALNDKLPSEEKIENSHETNKPPIKSSRSIPLSDRAQKIYDTIEEARQQCINFYLQTKFGKDNVKHNDLINKFGTPNIEEFVRYNKGGPKPNATKHRCRAMAKVIRYFDEDIPIEELKKHELMIQLAGVTTKRLLLKFFKNGCMKKVFTTVSHFIKILRLSLKILIIFPFHL